MTNRKKLRTRDTIPVQVLRIGAPGEKVEVCVRTNGGIRLFDCEFAGPVLITAAIRQGASK
jgi:hypothetical protein